MKFPGHIALCIAAWILLQPTASAQTSRSVIDFCGQPISFQVDQTPRQNFTGPLNTTSISSFYQNTLHNRYTQVTNALASYRQQHSPDDWLYYQLIRRTAQLISPKEKNYLQYTLYKWYFLSRSGYDVMITVSDNKMLFYVQCDENIYNIPNRIKNGKQYICLNYHDYNNIDFRNERFTEINLPAPPPNLVFSYKVTRIPDIKISEYLEKDLHFSYNENDYHFKVKLTPQVQKLFTNYPVVDFDSYLNIPLSKETYLSLIPQLSKNLKGMKTKHGVDYLMRFTRYAFHFEQDTRLYGSEKRLSPEQTLFNDRSDCEDSVALFYYLVKEIYNLPMIVLSYPTHVTIAVEFEKPLGNAITYKGKKYTVCEPTPQKQDLEVGQSLPELNNVPYEVAYVYQP